MDAKFFQSWKFSLLAAFVALSLIGGYKLLFGPDVATRVADTRSRILADRTAQAFPDGRPSDDIMERQIVATTPLMSVNFSLRQLVGLISAGNHDIVWEPIKPDAFILRASGENALTKEKVEFAFQFVALDAPLRDGTRYDLFEGPAVALMGLALDREILTEEDIGAFLVSIMPDAGRY